MQITLGTKEQEIMNFLHERIFDPILQSQSASENLKQGVRLSSNLTGEVTHTHPF